MENTHEVYVHLETAELLKKAGFNWECHASYQNGEFTEFQYSSYFKVLIMDFNNAPDYMNQYSAPTLDVAQRWLREVKNIAVYTCPSYEPEKFVAPNVVADDEKWLMKWQVSATSYDIEDDVINLGDAEERCFDTCEEAQEAGIKKVLELILEKGE